MAGGKGGDGVDAGLIKEALERVRDAKGRIDLAAAAQCAVWEGGRPEGPHPLLLTSRSHDDPYPRYGHLGRFGSPGAMLMSELHSALAALHGGMQAVPSVRANMGCGVFASLFGLRQSRFEDKMPWMREHLNKGRIMGMGPEDLRVGGEFAEGLGYMEYMAEAVEGTGCRVYPLDFQSPFNIAHLVYGDGLFYELHDDPAFAHRLLGLATQAAIMGMEECLRRIPGSDSEVAHYSDVVLPRGRGGLKISEDTTTLISGAMMAEFAIPYTDMVLERFGGGYVHYCGRNECLFEAALASPHVCGLNFGNPEMHDMESVLRRLAERGKVYYGGVPMLGGESEESHFTRSLGASLAGGSAHLLLQCAPRDAAGLDAAVRAWDAACGTLGLGR